MMSCFGSNLITRLDDEDYTKPLCKMYRNNFTKLILLLKLLLLFLFSVQLSFIPSQVTFEASGKGVAVAEVSRIYCYFFSYFHLVLVENCFMFETREIGSIFCAYLCYFQSTVSVITRVCYANL